MEGDVREPIRLTRSDRGSVASGATRCSHSSPLQKSVMIFSLLFVAALAGCAEPFWWLNLLLERLYPVLVAPPLASKSFWLGLLPVDLPGEMG